MAAKLKAKKDMKRKEAIEKIIKRRQDMNKNKKQFKYTKIQNKERTSNKIGAPSFWTSDGIISKTVCPIYLKIDVLIVHIGHS